MADLLPVPESATWPTAMSAPHPMAVGSYGQEAEQWLLENVTEVGRPLVLRWWQRLALRRQLEHDEDGRLVWWEVVETTPRRSGKSVRLRAASLWRLHKAEHFGEQQLILLTGKDVPIVREIMLKAWPWAKARGYPVRQANGQEEIEHPDGSRWIIRSRESVYGYDVTMACVDEAHGVPSVVVDDGLEPALLERQQPQLVMTSTAHRMAKPLMRNRLAAATKNLGSPRRTLVLQWSAPADADVSDRDAWRLASPHWTPEREEMIADVLERALAGESEGQEDGEPDPIEALRAQYLNIWPGVRRSAHQWLPDDLVDRCAISGVQALPEGARVAAIESSVDRSRWSAAVSDGEHAQVGVGFSRLVEALSWVRDRGASEVVCHGVVAELLPPNLETPVHPITTGESCAATSLLADAVSHASIGWEVLAGPPADLPRQFAHVVTAPTMGGPKIAPRLSRGPVEAVVALGWAHWRAVQERPEPGAVY